MWAVSFHSIQTSTMGGSKMKMKSNHYTREQIIELTYKIWDKIYEYYSTPLTPILSILTMKKAIIKDFFPDHCHILSQNYYCPCCVGYNLSIIRDLTCSGCPGLPLWGARTPDMLPCESTHSPYYHLCNTPTITRGSLPTLIKHSKEIRDFFKELHEENRNETRNQKES